MEIYKTTNQITGEYYIGLNTTSKPNYLGSGVQIKKQIKKYGKENFIKEILCLVTSTSTDENILRKIEHAYICNHIQNKKCLNISIGYTKGEKEVKKIYIEKIIEVDTYKEKYEKMKEEVISVSKIGGVYKTDGVTPYDGYGAKRMKNLVKLLSKEIERKPIGRNLSYLLSKNI